MKKTLLGVDVGGTKCAITLGFDEDGKIDIKDKIRFSTTTVDETIANIIAALKEMMTRHNLKAEDVNGIGISCGGPLSSKTGVVMSPPNLPGWDNIPIVKMIEDATGVKAALQNDANACALAEWAYGAGERCSNMAFLTFGTGLGAGLILDGKLYTGTNDNAGELGHIRLEDYGPVGYGKAGSFEGFCSGGGIRQIGQSLAKEKLMMGEKVSWCPDGDLDKINGVIIAKAMNEGDELARRVYEISAEHLGKGLSILIDIINPERIVIGSVYTINEKMMKPIAEAIINSEALSLAAKVCKLVPAALGDAVGDYAALAVASTV